MIRTLTLALLLLVALPATAAIPAAHEAVAKADLARVPALSLTMPDRLDLAREDALRRADGLPHRFAVPEDVALTTGNSGVWTEADGSRTWRLRVSTPGATTLNLGFSRFGLPASARLVVFPVANPEAGLAWDVDDVAAHGQLWTPVFGGDELVIELTVDADQAHLVDLELGTIGRGYRGFTPDGADKSGSCNIDVVCPEGDDWRQEIKSAGGVSLGGSLFCSGAMINNTAEDERPLFLTANHCGIWSGNEASVVIYWNFESVDCGDQGGGSLSQFQSGSTVLASWSGSDFTLLELDDAPDAAFDVRWAGWDRRDRDNTASTGIHHPSGDEKSICFDDDPTTITSYTETAVPGDGTHLRIGAWNAGTTEGGSSGSPLFNEDHRITGQLHGGFAACTAPDESDWYGRLAVSWEGSGEAGGRLRDHLDPLDTGVEYLDMLGEGLVLDPVAPAAFSGPFGGPFAPDSVAYTLSNRATSPKPIVFELVGDGDWFHVVSQIGDVPAEGSLAFRIELSETAVDLEPGAYTGAVRILDAPGGDLYHEVDVRLQVASLGRGVKVTAVAPNPAMGPVATIHYTLGADKPVSGRVYDMRGLRVADLGTWSPGTGEHTLEWAPRTVQGGTMPSGLYVLELESDGVTSRQRFAIVR